MFAVFFRCLYPFEAGWILAHPKLIVRVVSRSPDADVQVARLARERCRGDSVPRTAAAPAAPVVSPRRSASAERPRAAVGERLAPEIHAFKIGTCSFTGTHCFFFHNQHCLQGPVRINMEIPLFLLPSASPRPAPSAPSAPADRREEVKRKSREQREATEATENGPWKREKTAEIN